MVWGVLGVLIVKSVFSRFLGGAGVIRVFSSVWRFSMGQRSR